MKISSEAITMIKEGKSLNQIIKSTSFNKSSLYYHYKKLNGKKFKHVTINEKDKEKIGEFLGIFAGDGNFYFSKKLYKYSIRIYTGLYEKQYADYINNFLKELFKKEPQRYVNKDNNVITTCYYSKDIYELIKKYLIWEDNKTKTIRLKVIRDKDKAFLIGFLRGLFDTDGGIYKPKKKVAFGTASENLANQIREIIVQLGMTPGFYKYKNKDFWYLDMYGENSYKFMKLIKPHNKNKVL